MDDLEKQLETLLSDPSTMERVQGLLGSLGGADDAPPASPQPTEPPASAVPSLEGLLPLLTSSGKGNPDTALLQALRPYLHGEREKRLEEALKLMQLTELLPLLRL